MSIHQYILISNISIQSKCVLIWYHCLMYHYMATYIDVLLHLHSLHNVWDIHTGRINLLCLDNPQGEIIQNQFSMPLPRISNREVVAMKIWIPETLTTDNKSGLFIPVCIQVAAVRVCMCRLCNGLSWSS